MSRLDQLDALAAWDTAVRAFWDEIASPTPQRRAAYDVAAVEWYDHCERAGLTLDETRSPALVGDGA